MYFGKILISREYFNCITSALNNESLRYKEWAEEEDDAEVAEDYMTTSVRYREIELYLYEQWLAGTKDELNKIEEEN